MKENENPVMIATLHKKINNNSVWKSGAVQRRRSELISFRNIVVMANNYKIRFPY